MYKNLIKRSFSMSRVTSVSGTNWETKAGCVRATKVGNHIWVSGTCAQGETVTIQTNAIFKVIQTSLEELGSGLGDVVITRMFAADVKKDFQELGQAHFDVFSPHGVKPCNTLVGAELLLDAFKVEIECEAIIS